MKPAEIDATALRDMSQTVFAPWVIALDLQVLDAAGRVIEPYTSERSVPVTGDATRLPVTWRGRSTLDELRGETVRFRFTLTRAELFAFWVSPAPGGHSRGFLAAGGPGYARHEDVGSA